MNRSIAATLLAVGALVAADGVQAYSSRLPGRPLVFEAETGAGFGAPECHSFGAKEACIANHCWWCESAAVRSSCYTEEEAAQLPPAVFQCDKGATLSWELTEV